MKVRLVNEFPFAGTIKQFSIDDEHGDSVGGFSLALTPDTAVMMGYHVDAAVEGRSWKWVFRWLLATFPTVNRLSAYLAKWKVMRNWRRSGNRWLREEKEGQENGSNTIPVDGIRTPADAGPFGG